MHNRFSFSLAFSLLLLTAISAHADASGFTATMTFDRIDFGLDYLSGAVLSDEVEIIIQAEFAKQ